jgi:hypothetical protein
MLLVLLVSEDYPDGQTVFWPQFACSIELEELSLFAEERLRQLAREPGSIPSISTDAPTVFKGFQRCQGLLEYLGGRFPVSGGDPADTASVLADDVRVKKCPTLNQRSSIHLLFHLTRCQ